MIGWKCPTCSGVNRLNDRRCKHGDCRTVRPRKAEREDVEMEPATADPNPPSSDAPTPEDPSSSPVEVWLCRKDGCQTQNPVGESCSKCGNPPPRTPGHQTGPACAPPSGSAHSLVGTLVEKASQPVRRVTEAVDSFVHGGRPMSDNPRPPAENRDQRPEREQPRGPQPYRVGDKTTYLPLQSGGYIIIDTPSGLPIGKVDKEGNYTLNETTPPIQTQQVQQPQQQNTQQGAQQQSNNDPRALF